MILDAARRIARDAGWPAVTIRAVADALGYASPLIYQHFRDKGDVLAAAEAYVAFARREPAVYQLMHGMGGVVLDSAETARGAAVVCEVGVDALRTWAAASGVLLRDPFAATEVLWCALHRVTCLALAGRLGAHAPASTPTSPHAPGHADALLRHTVEVLAAGWRGTSGAASA